MLRIGVRNPHNGLTHIVTTATLEHLTVTDSELADYVHAGNLRPFASVGAESTTETPQTVTVPQRYNA